MRCHLIELSDSCYALHFFIASISEIVIYLLRTSNGESREVFQAGWTPAAKHYLFKLYPR